MCRFFNEVRPVRRSELAAAVCTKQLLKHPMEVASGGDKRYRTQEYVEGLQRTPGLKSSLVTTAVWRVASNSKYHTSNTAVITGEHNNKDQI